MKKLLAFLLVAVMVLSLWGCSLSGTKEETVDLDVDSFQVGFCRVVINPTKSVPLSGYGNAKSRYFTEVGEDITATVVAISDGEGNHILLVSTDISNAGSGFMRGLAPTISQKTGIPQEQIIVAGCHSHASIEVSYTEEPAVVEYNTIASGKIVDAAVAALKDRKPAQMYTGSVETENLNFVRHYKTVTDTGETVYFGDNFGTSIINDTTVHTTEADPTMHLLKFTREGGEDVVVVNWRAHPHFDDGSARTLLSSDFIGSFRNAFEDQTGVNVVFFQGAAGNINANSRISRERRTADGRTFGTLLAGYAIEGITNNMTQVETGTIQHQQVEFSAQIKRADSQLYSQAVMINALYDQMGNTQEFKDIMATTQIRSRYHASSLISNAALTENNAKMTLNAVSIGEDFAFVTFPGEMFDTISVNVEEGSPYDSTMFIGYAVHHVGYLPSLIAFEYTSYETDITRYEAGTGEAVGEQFIKMLNELKNNG